MTTKSISSIANEILQYKGKCNVDVSAISKKLMNLDESLTKHQRHKQLKRDQPVEN